MNRAVFVDRDGVINAVVLRNGRPHPPPSVEEMQLLPGVTEAINSLREGGFKIIVVTNQPDVARGVQDKDTVDAIHQKIQGALSIDEIKTCFHDDQDACPCRKPRPGMLTEAAKRWAVDLKRSFMVGDRWRDVEAGRAAGCKTILVGAGYAERKPKDPDAVVSSLLEASALILSGGI